MAPSSTKGLVQHANCLDGPLMPHFCSLTDHLQLKTITSACTRIRWVPSSPVPKDLLRAANPPVQHASPGGDYAGSQSGKPKQSNTKGAARSIKAGQVPQSGLMGPGDEVSIISLSSDLEDDGRQPAQDATQATAGSNPAFPRRNPTRAAGTAGIAKRINSTRADPTMPPAKRHRSAQTAKAHCCPTAASAQPLQPSTLQAVEAPPAIDLTGEQDHDEQQQAPAEELGGTEGISAKDEAFHLGCLVGLHPQRIIIGGDNSSLRDAAGYVPHLVSLKWHHRDL